MSTLEQCEKYFATRDVYKVFGLAKDATEQEIKKAYYKLSLQVHPDRVGDDEKAEATEKFKLLSKLYQVMSDKQKRGAYDDTGVIDDEDESKLTSWLDLWRTLFKPITEDEISSYEKEYVGSELERTDIQKSYLKSKGDIDRMMNEVPFLKCEDEPRLQSIVKEMIDAGAVPDYEIFTDEPKQKRQRRHKKYARESKEAEQIKKRIASKKKAASAAAGSSLEQQIMERNREREGNFGTLMDRLMEKYGGEDDSDVVDFSKLNKNKSKNKKKKSASVSSAKKGKGKGNEDSADDEKLHEVLNGKVKKQRAR